MSDLFKSKNRFDLEQEILKCWNVIDDINVVLNMMDRDYTEDELMNALIGITTIYNQRFETLFETFETCLKNKELS